MPVMPTLPSGVLAAKPSTATSLWEGASAYISRLLLLLLLLLP